MTSEYDAWNQVCSNSYHVPCAGLSIVVATIVGYVMFLAIIVMGTYILEKIYDTRRIC